MTHTVTTALIPHPALRHVVTDYHGFVEQAPFPVQREELPDPRLTLLIVLRGHLTFSTRMGGAFSLTGPAAAVVGLTSAEWVCTHQGRQEVLEVQVSPLAAPELFGPPARDLTGRVTPLFDLWGQRTEELLEQMLAIVSWRQRSRLLDAALSVGSGHGCGRGHPVAPEIAQAWHSIRHSGGGVTVSQLHQASGWSRQRFGQRFAEQMGLPPGVMARMIRFRRAASLIEKLPLSAAAIEAGYFDQPHMNREFHSWSGRSPLSWLASREADTPGTAMRAAIVQDVGTPGFL